MPPEKSSSSLYEYILALRPWSLTASIIPILVTAAVVKAQYLSIAFIRALSIGITVQSAANLTNTYFDFVNGVDNSTHNGGEKTLVEKKVSKSGVLVLIAILYAVSILLVYPILDMREDSTLKFIFFSGLALSFLYTATPMALKYIALGDIVVFLCFGPLLMQCTSILLTGRTNDSIYLYSLPIGLLTEAILHANNARDIKADSAVGVVTLACLIGSEYSYQVYISLLAGAYVSIIYIAAFCNWGCAASLLTIPLAVDLNRRYRAGKMLELPNETAQMHLPFGVLMFLGVLLTTNGFLS